MIGKRAVRHFIVGASALAAAAGPAFAEAPQKPADAPPPAPKPLRTEILNFDNWSVTCQDFAEGKRKHVCVAALQIVQQNTNQAVFTWTINYDDDNRAVSTFQTPTGVSIPPGIELKFAKSSRTVPFATCETGRCTATLVFDPTIARDIAASPSIEASLHGSAGNSVQFTIPMKGYDRAFTALQK